MSSEIITVSPDVLTVSEQEQLDQNIGALIDRYKANRQEVNRLVFESVSAMTAGEDYEHQLARKKGLQRFIGGITGSNKKLQDKINSSRAAAQYASQLTLQRLAEQNLMGFDLITAVNNKLNASVISIEGELNEVYSTLIRFFKQSRSDVVQLENRVAQLEQNVALLNWQNSIEFQMFDGIEYAELDSAAKIVCMVRDFYNITKGAWKTSDLMLLKAAMSSIGLAPREKTSVAEFLRSVTSSPLLMEKLLDGSTICQLPEPYLVPLLSMKKQEMLDTDEAFILDTIEDTLAESGLSADRVKLEERLVHNYVAQESQVDLDTPITNYDLMLELLFDLSQAVLSGTLSSCNEVVEDIQIEAPVISETTAPEIEQEPVAPSPEEDTEKKKQQEQSALAAEREEYLKKADELWDKARSESDKAVIAKIYKDALECYLKAENAGNGRAYHRAGQLYQSGWSSLAFRSDEYYKTVESLYQKSADMDNPDGQCALANFYYFMDLDNDPEYMKKAHKLFERAAEQGNTRAQDFLDREKKLSSIRI